MRQGAGFFGVFAAVVLALFAHDYGSRWIDQRLAHHPATVVAIAPPPDLPQMLGPYTAMQAAHSRSCINGYAYDRIDGQWRLAAGPAVPCVTTSP